MRDAQSFGQQIKWQDAPRKVLRGTVFEAGAGTAGVELSDGVRLRRVATSGTLAVGDVVDVELSAGKARILTAGEFSGGSLALTSASGGPSTGAPSPHDLLGSHHTLPTLAANLFLAAPSAASGSPSFRAIVAADLPGQFAGFANPTAQIGLTAVNGSAATAMRSDAAPALSQAITPTWSGLHTFSAGQRVSSSQVVEFGWSVAGKQTDAGKIGYQTFSTALDIVGAGTASGQRAIKLWDNTWIAGYVGSESYTSQTTGWRIDSAGGGDFRYLFTDEMHAKSFIADLEQALAGGQIISKSVAMMGKTFTAPAAAGTATLWVRDLPSAANMAAFQSGDIVRIRTFNRSAGSLSITDCWGVVTSYADGSGADEGLQSWTFTRSSAPNAGAMTAGTTVPVDAIILDYGTSGNGIWETNAIDGAYGANSPYTQAVQWTGHPATGSVVRYRAGKLDGWGSMYAGTNTFGFAAGNVAGTWIAAEATNGFRIMYGTTPIAQVASGMFLFRGLPSASVNVGALRWNSSSYVFEGGYYAPAAGPAYGAFTQQWSTDAATGAIVAGGGNVTLDGNGLTLYGGNSSWSSNAALKFSTSTALQSGVYAGQAASNPFLALNLSAYSDYSPTIYITSYAIGTSAEGKILLRANFNGWQSRIDIGAVAGIKYHSGQGRHYFTDSELSTGNGLRVGAAWSMYGIYAESGYCAVGGASGVNLQNGVVQITSGMGVLRAPIDATYNALAVNGGVHLTGSNTTFQMDARDNSGQTWQAYAESNTYRIWVTSVGDVVRFDTSGNASKLSAGTAWTSFSDGRVKDVRGAYERGLTEILRIRPIVYDYNGRGGTIPNGKRNAGVLAQEIREIFPESVSEDRDTGLLMFDATEITWALVNAVKELSRRLERSA